MLRLRKFDRIDAAHVILPGSIHRISSALGDTTASPGARTEPAHMTR